MRIVNYKQCLLALPVIGLMGCATLTSDAMDPIVFSFSDGSTGSCLLQNKRGSWSTQVPGEIPVRRSDDELRYECETEDGRTASGSIPSAVGGKIVASAVFLDFGITDAITDKHRDYPDSYAIPVPRREKEPEIKVAQPGGDAEEPTTGTLDYQDTGVQDSEEPGKEPSER